MLVGKGRGRGRRRQTEEVPEDFITQQIRLHVGTDHHPSNSYTKVMPKITKQKSDFTPVVDCEPQGVKQTSIPLMKSSLGRGYYLKKHLEQLIAEKEANAKEEQSIYSFVTCKTKVK